RDDAAHRVTDDVNALEARGVGDRPGVGRHLLDRDRAAAELALAHATVVERDEPIAVAQPFDLRPPALAGDADARDQQHAGRALDALARVADAGSRGVDERHGRRKAAAL